METTVVTPGPWPNYVPTILGRYRRKAVAGTPHAAIPLADLFRYGRRDSIAPMAGDPDELRAWFRLRSDCRIMALGVGSDYEIERLWRHHESAPLGRWLVQMNVELATAPNYSYFTYAPKEHYLWNRKRMLLFVRRLAQDGFPVIPHLYGDTFFDWRWWAQFFRDHPTLNACTLELQTSDAHPSRLEAFIDGLKVFSNEVGRPLTAFIAGGRHCAKRIAPLFHSIVVIEASAYMKTVRRRFAEQRGHGRLRWRKTQTVGGLELLLDHNIRTVGHSIVELIERARAQTARNETTAALS